MKICFVQPSTNYQVQKHRYALSLTFPQLILNMDLKEKDYEVYYEGKTRVNFCDFIKKHNITHVLITSITSTFPNAIKFATLAKKEGVTTVLGGIFPSASSECISKNYSCFDCICTGKPNEEFLHFLKDELPNQKQHPFIYISTSADNFKDSIADIMLTKKFTDVFNNKETVCYEITQGCPYNCSFCTIRMAFGSNKQCRKIDLVENDIQKLKYWKKLKLIDDDIHQSLDVLKHISFQKFDEVIAETRIDNINENFMKIVSSCGITHLITGVETFENEFLKKSNKSNADFWDHKVENAIKLSQKYNIILRPVVMLNYPGFNLNSARLILNHVNDWTPDNNIELLLSFYTPHPGMHLDGGELITNDLKYFDHLNPVYLPRTMIGESITELLDIYTKIVKTTRSQEYNPQVTINNKIIDSYKCFFPNA